ncbi:MAG: hypothetical protein R3C01_06360 [Planctomycetaceae bacterium]
MENPSEESPPASQAEESHLGFPRWIRRLWTIAAFVHGLLAVALLLSFVRGILIITNRLDGYVGRDPKVWLGISTIMIASAFASVAAWKSRDFFAVGPIRLTILAAILVILVGPFIVPLHEAWVGIVNAAIATCGVAVTAVLARHFGRHAGATQSLHETGADSP